MSDVITAIVQAISTVGFPIACCCFLLYRGSKQDEYHREEMEKLRQTIEKNTSTLSKLAELIKKVIDT